MWFVLTFIIGALAGVVGGFFLAKYVIQEDLKKNPPLNEDVMRTMMAQMGQKPSEAKLRQMMKATAAAQAKSKK